jgi:hypothetical protein
VLSLGLVLGLGLELFVFNDFLLYLLYVCLRHMLKHDHVMHHSFCLSLSTLSLSLSLSLNPKTHLRSISSSASGT